MLQSSTQSAESAAHSVSSKQRSQLSPVGPESLMLQSKSNLTPKDSVLMFPEEIVFFF